MRLSIAFFVPGLPFDGRTIYERSLGGSESAAVFLARELAKLGHRVFVFCGTGEPAAIDGVTYIPADHYPGFAARTPHDVSIIQRAPNVCTGARAAKVVILWQHDLAHVRSSDVLMSSLWAIDRVAVLSDFMADQYRQAIDLPEKLMFRTRNGVDLEMIAQAEPLAPERDRRSILYVSRPERGLDVLLTKVFPALLERVPDARLHLCSYDNSVEHLRHFYGEIDRLVRLHGDRVVQHGHLAKPELYRLMKSVGALVYPTPSPMIPEFAETSCIAVMEAMACGLPVVASARGAIPETCGPEAGALLVPGSPSDAGHIETMVERIVELMQPPPDQWSSAGDSWQEMSEFGLARAAQLSWAGVAAQWQAEILDTFARVNDDPVRLARHFDGRQDVDAAIKALDLAPDRPDAQAYREDLARRYAFATDQESLAQHYQGMQSEDHEQFLERLAQTPQVFVDTPHRRFQLIADLIGRAEDVRVVLDYGCAQGEGSIVYHNRTGRTVIGADVSEHAIAWAKKLSKYAKGGDEGVSFVVADHRRCAERLGQARQMIDCLVLGEVLEHVLDPWDVVETLQLVLRPGGLVIVTMPWGPWETGYGGPSQHLREWSAADLHEVFGAQDQVSIDTIVTDENPHTGEPRGYTICAYRATNRPLGQIDWSRKLLAQRPRQTLSVTMMCGGSAVEETLHWCLRSIKPVADELVIADSGMSAEARRIAESYGARLVPSSSPLDVGFETPRNDALAAATCDWVLWIDADERLLRPLSLKKYLRENHLHGYGIKQHHLAVDTAWQPDVPCRLFRRRPLDGKTMRFFGMIHEHPELGLNEGPGPVLIVSDLEIAHIGYLQEGIRRDRFQRNLPMLQRDIAIYPERRLQKHLICREFMLLAKFKLEQNGGLMTDEIRRLCQETIETYRTHFLGQPTPAGFDTLQYYAAACRLLGLGFDVEFEVRAARDGVGDPVNGRAVRYASQEDFLADVTARAKQAVARFEHKYW